MFQGKPIPKVVLVGSNKYCISGVLNCSRMQTWRRKSGKEKKTKQDIKDESLRMIFI